MIHISKKYLRKNDIRICTHPDTVSPNGDNHNVYITAKRGHKSKVNVITHSPTFFGEPTEKFNKNPNISSKDKRPSRFSVPRWYSDKTVKEKPLKGTWRISKSDRTKIKKFNKKYDNNYK